MEGLVLKSIIVKVLERDDLNEFMQLYNFEEDVIKISNRYSINEILSLEKNITLNQKVTLYTYIFLYKKLKNINNSKNRLIEIAKEFNLEDSVYENCTYFFNKDRLNYIRMDYNQKNLKLYNVLIEVDDYISNLVTKVVSVPIRKNKKNLVGLKSREYEYNNFYDSINSEMILKQATDFEELDNSKYNKIMKYLSIMNSDHPWTVLRAKELKSWYDNGEYNRILNRNVNNQITNNQINYVQKFCTQCGSKLKPNAKFCTFCGERV